jgi:RNA polymerase-binding transcription factor DksA
MEQIMSAITAADAGKFRTILRARAAVLREEIRQALLRSDQEQYIAIAEQARDAQDDSFADLMIDVNLAEIDRDLAELREIDVALERLAEGTYGRCEMCTEEIDRARLEAQPAAVRCLACQTEFEQSHPQSTPRL